MEVICENCKAKLNIPDEKIPQGRKVVIGCPKCKNKLTLTGAGPKPESAPPAVSEVKEPEAPEADVPFEYEEEDVDLGFIEEGVKLALVINQDPQETEKIQEAVEGLDVQCVLAGKTGEALSMLRLHHFDIVLLSDPFDGIEIEQSPILHYMNHLSMSFRRRIFLGLISDSFKTMDNMMAFKMSANLVVSRDDIDKLPEILKKAVSDNEKFYKVFMSSLVDLGRA